MIKDWKIWEKLRRNLERTPAEEGDMEVVVSYYTAFAIGITCGFFAFGFYLSAMLNLMRNHLSVAVGDAGLCIIMTMAAIALGNVMDIYRKNRKYAPKVQYIHGYTRAKRGMA